jgi:hypothetical protein
MGVQWIWDGRTVYGFLLTFRLLGYVQRSQYAVGD